MKKIHIFQLLTSLGILTYASSCKKPVEETELITTVKITLQDSVLGTSQSYFWRDPDGDGGNAPSQIDTVLLDTSKTYYCTLFFADESGGNYKDITTEIEEEGADHKVCFESIINSLLITPTDSDGTYSIGLKSTWRTGTEIANGTLKILLKHQPEIKDGTCAPGETDVDVTFPVKFKT